MFNFTTTTLIHSRDQFMANPTNTTFQGGYSDPSVVKGSSKNTFWVNGVNLFRKENVVAIYRSPYVDPLAGRLVVKVADACQFVSSSNLYTPSRGGKYQFRLRFSLRRTGDNNSYYARDEVFKGKDFVYEWVGDASTTAADVAKQIKKINRLYGDIYLDVHVGKQTDNDVLNIYDSGDSTNTGSTTMSEGIKNEFDEMNEVNQLVFVNDNFGMFTDAVLEVWQDGVSNCCVYEEGGWIPFDQIDCYDTVCVSNCSATACDNITRGMKQSTKGYLHIVDCVNGVGTYAQILRDLRLPTMENLAYGSLTQQMDEMPVPGNKYVQYTLHYVTCRGILGGSAVGEVTHSKTTHVFFVPDDCCPCAEGLDQAFQDALNAAFGWSACTGEEGSEAPVGRLVPAPHDDPTVEPNMYNHMAPASKMDTRTSNDTVTEADESGIPTAQAGGGGGDVPLMYDKRTNNTTFNTSNPNSGTDPEQEPGNDNG